MALEGIVHWAGNREVTPTQLRAARIEVSKEFSKRCPSLDTEKAEYVRLGGFIDQMSGEGILLPAWRLPDGFEIPAGWGERCLLWTIGHREIARRLARQLLVNHAEEINKPRYLRRKATTVGYATIYELDPRSHRFRGQLESIQLERILSRYQSMLNCMDDFVPFSAGLNQSRDCRDAEFDAFQIALAAHEFQRIHGDFPGTLKQLVPTFIDAIPFDSTSPNGCPIGYRREENGQAIVWSCGFDETDDDGDIGGNQPKDRGYRIQLNHKTWKQAGNTED